jgi:hypothetical protein
VPEAAIDAIIYRDALALLGLRWPLVWKKPD